MTLTWGRGPLVGLPGDPVLLRRTEASVGCSGTIRDGRDKEKALASAFGVICVLKDSFSLPGRSESWLDSSDGTEQKSGQMVHE